MLENTRGIVLRTIKYGDTSVITSIFTERYGVQSYILKGVRSSRSRQNRTGLLQPGSLLDLTVYRSPLRKLEMISDFQPAYTSKTFTENMLKNSILLFSIEILLRLLPESAIVPDLFQFSYSYFIALDQNQIPDIANYPLFFILKCSRLLGYEINGRYSQETSYLNIADGGYSSNHPDSATAITPDDAFCLDKVIEINDLERVNEIKIQPSARHRLLAWLIEFLQRHTHHMGKINSFEILTAILH